MFWEKFLGETVPAKIQQKCTKAHPLHHLFVLTELPEHGEGLHVPFPTNTNKLLPLQNP